MKYFQEFIIVFFFFRTGTSSMKAALAELLPGRYVAAHCAVHSHLQFLLTFTFFFLIPALEVHGRSHVVFFHFPFHLSCFLPGRYMATEICHFYFSFICSPFFPLHRSFFAFTFAFYSIFSSERRFSLSLLIFLQYLPFREVFISLSLVLPSPPFRKVFFYFHFLSSSISSIQRSGTTIDFRFLHFLLPLNFTHLTRIQYSLNILITPSPHLRAELQDVTDRTGKSV